MALHMTRLEILENVMTVLDRFLKLSHNTTQNQVAKIDENTDVYTDLGMDSVEIIDFIGELENHFKIKIDVDKLNSKKTIGDIVTLLKG